MYFWPLQESQVTGVMETSRINFLRGGEWDHRSDVSQLIQPNSVPSVRTAKARRSERVEGSPKPTKPIIKHNNIKRSSSSDSDLDEKEHREEHRASLGGRLRKAQAKAKALRASLWNRIRPTLSLT